MRDATFDKKNSFILKRFKRLMHEEDWKKFCKGITFRVIAGALNGLALLILLPASTALIVGKSVWGLSVGRWLLVLGVIAILSAIIDYFGTEESYIRGLRFMESMHYKVGDKIASLPLGWFDGASAGALSRMVTQEMMSLAQHLAAFSGQLFNAAAGAMVVVVGTWFWDWRLGLLLTAGTPIFYLLLKAGRALLDKGKKIADPPEQELAMRIIEFARCQGAIRSTHAGSSYRELQNAIVENRKTGKKALLWETLGQVISGVFMQNIIIAIIFLAAQWAINGTMDPLSAFVTMGMGLRFFNILESINSSVIGLSERKTQLDHIDEVLDAKTLTVPQSSTPFTNRGAVAFSNVAFAYAKDKPVLKDISFAVAPQTMCALVGPSGSGKTTIESLIARFYDVDHGSVQVGGVDVRDLTTEDLMKEISMVFQNVYLFDDTLEANIRVGNPCATQAEIERAANLAGVTEIVKRLPNGWQTQVGEGGGALSGGERQRVSIARALLKKAPIVLLDEATSALDAENEANIVASMAEIRKHATLIVIAHKLETIEHADQIIMLSENGTVALEGTHEMLLAMEGPYRKYWAYRSQSVGWQLA